MSPGAPDDATGPGRPEAGASGAGAPRRADHPRGAGEADAPRRILALGTLTLDTVETPGGPAPDPAPGGSALYFAAAAALLAPVRVVGVRGEDFPDAVLERLGERGVDPAGIVRLPGPTMRWHARYDDDLAGRTTVSADRGVLDRWTPEVPRAWRDTPLVFLGSTDPRLQAAVLEQSGDAASGGSGPEGAPWVAMDTMAHWIRDRREEVERAAAGADLVLVSEAECRDLGGARRVRDAAARIRALGPRWVVVKRGPRGATLLGGANQLPVPAFPVERVVDPTGAGDAFAGGLVGWLARSGGGAPGPRTLRRALAAGAAAASFAVEDFSIRGLLARDRAALVRRMERVEAAGAG